MTNQVSRKSTYKSAKFYYLSCFSSGTFIFCILGTILDEAFLA